MLTRYCGFIDELHLTRADAFCMLQPRFHHLDAIAENEKANSRMQREAEHGGPEPEARAINMAVKSTGEDELDKSDIAKWLREVQEEKWERLEWIDEGVSVSRAPAQSCLLRIRRLMP